MNKKALPAMYCPVFWCLLVVFLFFVFLALLHNHWYSLYTRRYSLQTTKSRLVISIWLQSPGPVAIKMPFFAEIQIRCKFFQLQPKRETSFSSLGDNATFCAKRETRGRKLNSQHAQQCWELSVLICARVAAVCSRCDPLKFKSM